MVAGNRGGRLRVLYVTPNEPISGTSGGRLRARALYLALRAMAKVEVIVAGEQMRMDEGIDLTRHDVRVWWPPYREGVGSKVLRYVMGIVKRIPVTVGRYLGPERMRYLEQLCSGQRIDVLILGDTELSVLARLLRPRIPYIICDNHNVWTVQLSRIRGLRGNWLHRMHYFAAEMSARHAERSLLPLCDELWAVSSEDARMLRMAGPPVRVVPNAIDLDRYRRPSEVQRLPAVVFTGWYGYKPNEDAALRLIRIVERSREQGVQVLLFLVGRDPTATMRKCAFGKEWVTVTGPVEDVRPYLWQASVMVAPLWAGGGTKLKVMEAMAAGLPVVTTPLGVEGLGIPELSLERSGVAVCHSEGEMVDAVIGAMKDEGRLTLWARRARETAEERFGFDAVYTAVAGALERAEKVLSQRRI